MIAWFTIFHLPLILLIYVAWKLDSDCSLILTPFTVYVTLDIVFSWNYWLLFSDYEYMVTPYSVGVSMLSTGCFLVGCIFYSKNHEIRGSTKTGATYVKDFIARPIRLRGPRSKYKRAVKILLLLSLLLSGYYYRGLPPSILAISRFIASGELREAHTALSSGRRELTKSYVFEGGYRGQGIAKSFMRVMWTYGLTVCLLFALLDRSPYWILFSGVFFLGCLYFIAGTGERAPFLYSLISVLIALSYVLRLRLRHLTLTGMLLLLLLLVTTFLMPRYDSTVGSRTDLLMSVLNSVKGRILTGNKVNNLLVINFVADGTLDYAYGRDHLSVFLNAIPGVPAPPLAHEIATIIKGTTTTYFSGTYLGKVYIDFGVYGVILVYVLLGITLQATHRYFLARSKTIENLAFLGLLNWSLGWMCFGAGVITLLSNMVPVVSIHMLMLFFIGALRPTRTRAYRMREQRTG